MSGQRSENKSGQRTYIWRGEPYWSVTTIIGGGLPKPALLPWGIKMVAEGAAQAVQDGHLQGLVHQDFDGAVRFLKGLPYATRDKAADLGTQIHEAIEAYALGRPYPKWPALVNPRMLQFERFLNDYQPVFEMTEAPVYNATEKYAGTLDAIVAMRAISSTLDSLDGSPRRWLLDVKTGKDVYPDVALQLAAYRYAEFIGAPDGSEQPMPPVDAACVLHLTDHDYKVVEVEATERVFLAFRYVREVYRWQQDTSKDVLLPNLAPLREVVA